MRSCLPGDQRELHPVATQLHGASPVVTQFEPLLFPEEADYVVGAASGRLEPSETGREEEGVVDEYRTSNSARLPMQDKVIDCLARRLATIAGMPSSSVEPLQVTRYTRGQEYRPHTDDPERAPHRKRLKTTFTYLSDEGLANGHCGGATRFTHLA